MKNGSANAQRSANDAIDCRKPIKPDERPVRILIAITAPVITGLLKK